IFGQGVDYSGIRPEVIVVQGNEPDHQLRPLPEEIDDYVEVVAETTDLNAAIEQLRQGDVDGVAIIPPDPEGTVTSGEQIPVQIFTSDIDPVSIQFTEAYLLDQVAELNRNALAEAIQDAQSSVGDVEAQVASAREYIAAA